jgi:gliding motility-associated-like protein
MKRNAILTTPHHPGPWWGVLASILGARRIGAWLLGLLGLSAQLPAQILMVNKADTVSVMPGTIMSVHGGLWNLPNGAFYNADTIYVKDTLRNSGGNEFYHDAWPGTTVLFGDFQVIDGPERIRFHTLKLTGNGTKAMDQDIWVMDSLHLNDRTLDARIDTAFVMNPDPGAIQRTTGLVRADEAGRLWRETDRADDYLFPVGDTLPLRYRPVVINPQAITAAAFTVRMAQMDPTLDGFDREIKAPDLCVVNDLFYHRIRPVYGLTRADLTVWYDPQDDPVHRLLAQWQQGPGPVSFARWENTQATAAPGTLPNPAPNPNPLEGHRLTNWSNFQTEAFALAHPRTDVSFDPLPRTACSNDGILPFTGMTPPGGFFLVNGQPYDATGFDTDTLAIDYLIEYIYVDTLSPTLACIDTARQRVRIFEAPKTTLVADGPLEICEGEFVTLRSEPVEPHYQYQWFLDGVLLPNDTLAFLAARESGLYSIIVTEKYNDCVQGGDTLAVTVFPLPLSGITVVGDTRLCDGETATLVAEPGYDYTWYRNDTLLPGETSGSLTVGLPGRYRAVLTDPSQPTLCSAPATDTIAIEVIYAPQPRLWVQGTPDRCQGDSALLLAQDTAQVLGPKLYDWFLDGQPLFASPVPDSAIWVRQSGQYTVQVINECGEGTASLSLRLRFFAPPVADFDWLPDTVLTGEEVQFTDRSRADTALGDAIVFWQWVLPPDLATNELNPTHVFADSGLYPVSLTIITEFGCRDTVTKWIRVNDLFRIWVPNAFTPNGGGPEANERFVIKGMGIVSLEVEIYNRWGALIWTGNNPNEFWNGQTLDGQAVPEGVYVWLVRAISATGKRIEQTGSVMVIR